MSVATRPFGAKSAYIGLYQDLRLGFPGKPLKKRTLSEISRYECQ